MRIKSPDDWWIAYDSIEGKIENYAAEFGIKWNKNHADEYRKQRNSNALGIMLQKLWEDLPDHPAIHRGPFLIICDLCSENWVFEEKK